MKKFLILFIFLFIQTSCFAQITKPPIASQVKTNISDFDNNSDFDTVQKALKELYGGSGNVNWSDMPIIQPSGINWDGVDELTLSSIDWTQYDNDSINWAALTEMDLSGINWDDLRAYTETDPIFAAWDGSTGINWDDFPNDQGFITVSSLPDVTVEAGWEKVGTNVILSTISDNVGVGTSAPSAKLSIVDTLSTNNTSIDSLKITQTSSSSNSSGTALHNALNIVSNYSGGVTGGSLRPSFLNGTINYSGTVNGASANLTVGAGKLSSYFSGTNTQNGSINIDGFSVDAGGNLGTTGVTAHTGGALSASGTADVNYGLYVSAQDATLNYGVYSLNGTNYFNGNVGVGLTNPGQKIEVVGNVKASGYIDDVANTSGNILVADGTKFESLTMSGDVTINGQGTTTVNWDNNSYGNAWIKNDSTVSLVSSTDNVGIGISTPSQTLEVYGTAQINKEKTCPSLSEISIFADQYVEYGYAAGDVIKYKIYGYIIVDGEKVYSETPVEAEVTIIDSDSLVYLYANNGVAGVEGWKILRAYNDLTYDEAMDIGEYGSYFETYDYGDSWSSTTEVTPTVGYEKVKINQDGSGEFLSIEASEKVKVKNLQVTDFVTNGFVKTTGNNGTLYVVDQNYVQYLGSKNNYITKWTGPSYLGNSIVFDNGTNVGIGKTNPSYKLDVSGDVYAGTGLRVGAGSFVNNTARFYVGSANGATLTGQAGTLYDFALTESGGQIMAANIAGTNDMLLNPTVGNVGIGITVSAVNKLEVAGSIQSNQVTGSGIVAVGVQSLAGIRQIYTQDDLVFALTEGNLYIYDVSNVSSIVLRSTYSNSDINNATRFFVSGKYAYISCSHSNKVLILDISNTYSVSLAGEISDRVNSPAGMAMIGKYLFVSNYSNASLNCYDVSNPAVPSFVSSIANSVGGWVESQGNYVYTTPIFGDNKVRIFDMSNPFVPVEKVAWTVTTSVIPTAYAASDVTPATKTKITVPSVANFYDGMIITIAGTTGAEYDGTFVISNKTATTIDIVKTFGTNPANKGTVSGGALNNASMFKISGKLMFVADTYNAAIKAIDISNVTSPVLLSTYTTPSINGPISVEIAGDFLYLVNWATYGVTCLNISNPYAITFVCTFKLTSNAGLMTSIFKDKIYVSDPITGEFRVFKVSTVSAPAANLGVTTVSKLVSNGDISVSKDLSVTGTISSGNGFNTTGLINSTATGTNFIGGNLGLGVAPAPSKLVVLDGNVEIAGDTTVGAETLSEPDFSASTKWTAGTGWTISGGVATAKRTAAATLTQTTANMATPIVANKWYNFTYTVVSGSVKGACLESAPVAGGSGYSVGDNITYSGGGDGNAVAKVVTIGAGGSVTRVQTTYSGAASGSGYITSETAFSTTSSPGSGCTVKIIQIYTPEFVSLSGITTSAVYLPIAPGTYTIPIKTSTAPGNFVLTFDPVGSANSEIAFDNLSLKELKSGDLTVSGTSVLYGNVGVGTSTPSENLEVIGTFGVENPKDTYVISTSGTNVGIGTSAPSGKLSITHAVDASDSPALFIDANYGVQGGGGVSGNAIEIDLDMLDDTGATARGVYSAVTGPANSNNTSFYGVPTATSATNSNNYVLYGAPSGGATDWGVYITGEDKNYFSGNVGIGTTAPGYGLDVFKTVRIGGATTFSSFESDGTYVMTEGATVFDDIQFNISNGKVPAANAPSWSTFNTDFSEYSFAVNDYIDLGAQEFLHSWKEGTPVELHIHWATGSGNYVNGDKVNWQIQYTWANMATSQPFTAFSATATSSAETAFTTTVSPFSHVYTSVVSFTPTGGKIGAELKVRLKRIAKTAGGTDPGSNPFGLQVGIHFEKDTIGSRTGSAK